MNFEILNIALHHIDFEEETVENGIIKKENAEQYINSIIRKSVENDNVRYFKVKNENTQVISLTQKAIDYERVNVESNSEEVESISGCGVVTSVSEIAIEEIYLEEVALEISKRLMEKEKEAQSKIERMGNKIKKGSLIQATVNIDGLISYILAKVEHVHILDKEDWEKHTGLPIENQILKTCVITYDDNSEIESIKVSDSNKEIADYWSNGLLELDPMTSDDRNTDKSFKVIDNFLIRNIKKDSRADYGLLYNSLLGYYNQNTSFDYDDMVEKVFKNYEPINSEVVKFDELKPKLDKLPDGNFDRKFDVIIKVLRNKKKRIIKINSDIDLTLNDSIENLKDIIKGEKKPNNEYVLEIQVSKETFEEFNFEKIN